MIRDRAFLADWHRARSAEVLQEFRLVSRTEECLFSVVGAAVDDEIVLRLAIGCGGLEFRITEVEDPMALEAVHELMRHDAVRAEEIGTVEATRYGVGFGGLAAGATYAVAVAATTSQSAARTGRVAGFRAV